MSILDGKQRITFNGVTYNIQNFPHALAPWSQNADFLAALATATAGGAGLSANNIFTGSNTFTQDATFNARILMPNNASPSTGIQFGPATSAGVIIWRNGSGLVQFSLGDLSGNAIIAASQLSSTNDNGASSPNFRTSYKTNYGLYISNSLNTTNLVTNGVVALAVDSSQNATFASTVTAQTFTGTATTNGAPNELYYSRTLCPVASFSATATATGAQQRGGLVGLTGTTAAQTLTLAPAVQGYCFWIVNNSTQSWNVTYSSGITGGSLTGNTRTLPAASRMQVCSIDGTSYSVLGTQGAIT